MDYQAFEQHMLLDDIAPVKAVYAVGKTLRRINAKLMEHGERVAYIAEKIRKTGNFELDRKLLHALCVFHDIGAYETEAVHGDDQILLFETSPAHVQRHSVYGYLFLKYMTPLHEAAEAILYHHSPIVEIQQLQTSYKDYAALIHLADRIDVLMSYQGGCKPALSLLERDRDLFHAEYYRIARQCLQSGALTASLADQSYLTANLALCASCIHSAAEAFDYLKMIIYTIDFRSDHTVTHTVNTVAIAVNIALHFQLDNQEIEQIYIGALLHDIGKIAIPLQILEAPGRLTAEEMTVMRTHVEETAVLIAGTIPQPIYQIAIRHHEKLDGSGYPAGLTADSLSFAERIVAVADILSALSSRRSYKDPFPKEKTLAILQDMMGTQLDEQICQYILDDYDYIMQETDHSRKQVIDRYLHMRREYQDMMQNAD